MAKVIVIDCIGKTVLSLKEGNVVRRLKIDTTGIKIKKTTGVNAYDLDELPIEVQLDENEYRFKIFSSDNDLIYDVEYFDLNSRHPLSQQPLTNATESPPRKADASQDVTEVGLVDLTGSLGNTSLPHVKTEPSPQAIPLPRKRGRKPKASTTQQSTARSSNIQPLGSGLQDDNEEGRVLPKRQTHAMTEVDRDYVEGLLTQLINNKAFEAFVNPTDWKLLSKKWGEVYDSYPKIVPHQITMSKILEQLGNGKYSKIVEVNKDIDTMVADSKRWYDHSSHVTHNEEHDLHVWEAGKRLKTEWDNNILEYIKQHQPFVGPEKEDNHDQSAKRAKTIKRVSYGGLRLVQDKPASSPAGDGNAGQYQRKRGKSGGDIYTFDSQEDIPGPSKKVRTLANNNPVNIDENDANFTLGRPTQNVLDRIMPIQSWASVNK